MIFYFTATGNSLYAARQIGGGDELVSIAQELRKTDRHYQGDAIGIVVPLFEFDLPDVVDRFIATSTFDTDYFFIVSTFGMHSGGIAERVSKRLEAAGRHVDYYNTVIMVDNAIQVFDMEEQMRIDPEKHVDEQLEAVRADIAARRHYIQPATQEEVDFYEGYMANPAFDLHPQSARDAGGPYESSWLTLENAQIGEPTRAQAQSRRTKHVTQSIAQARARAWARPVSAHFH